MTQAQNRVHCPKCPIFSLFDKYLIVSVSPCEMICRRWLRTKYKILESSAFFRAPPEGQGPSGPKVILPDGQTDEQTDGQRFSGNQIFKNYSQCHLTPLNPLSVRSSVRPSGKVTFGPEGPQPSGGARKKPPVGGLNFLATNNFISLYYKLANFPPKFYL